ncbi:MAG: hypothetical protein ABI778_03530 [Ignavibacteriota bacterium]
MRYNFISLTPTVIAGGSINAQSQDRNHLLIGLASYQTMGNNFLTVDVSKAAPRLQGGWLDNSSQYNNGIWMGENSVGYFRKNSFNLVDFIITDTAGVKQDSLDISIDDNLYYTKTYHSPGFIFFAGFNGIIKYDSASKARSVLSIVGSYQHDAAGDGSFIVYIPSFYPYELDIINPKNGVSKRLANSATFIKISPAGNQLAYFDKSPSSGGKLIVIPVSAP